MISLMPLAPLTQRLANLWTPMTRWAPPVTAVDVPFDLPLAVCRKRTDLLGATHYPLLEVAVIGNPNHVKTHSL